MSLGAADGKQSEVLRHCTADRTDLGDVGLCSNSVHTPIINCVLFFPGAGGLQPVPS